MNGLSIELRCSFNTFLLVYFDVVAVPRLKVFDSSCCARIIAQKGRFPDLDEGSASVSAMFGLSQMQLTIPSVSLI